jgi:hypothetical protein
MKSELQANKIEKVIIIDDDLRVLHTQVIVNNNFSDK